MDFNSMISESISKEIDKSEKWIKDAYEVLKNEFGNKVMYDGVEYIVIGLQAKSEIEDGGKQFDGGYSFTVKNEMYIVLKSSFTNTTEISMKEYLNVTRRKSYESKIQS